MQPWPTKLAPGTLNIGINDDGFPKGFHDIGKGEGLKKLDEGAFRPAAVIPPWKIAGNTITPTADDPARGTALAWQAELQVISTGQTAKCWMLRRTGSSITAQIELVAENHLRSRLNLADGTAVKVTVFEAESKGNPPSPQERIVEWCETARGIEDEFGTDKALNYLIGEKFLDYLDAADRNPAFRTAIPVFVAEVKDIFERWQLAEYLETARQRKPFDPTDYDEEDEDYDPEFIEMDRQEDICRSANDLLLVERAKEWLLEPDDE